MVRMILYFKAAVIGGHRTTLIKESWVSLISEHAVYIYSPGSCEKIWRSLSSLVGKKIPTLVFELFEKNKGCFQEVPKNFFFGFDQLGPNRRALGY